VNRVALFMAMPDFSPKDLQTCDLHLGKLEIPFMLYLLFISLYLIFGLILFLLVYCVFSFFRVRRGKREGSLPSRLKSALRFLEAEGSVTMDEYGDYFSISGESSFKDLEMLENLGFAERVGEGRDIYYRFIGRT